MNAVALITGASRGIGRGIALGLARIGCDIVVNFRTNEQAARQTAKESVEAARASGSKIQCEIFQADISAEKDRRALIDFVKSRFGRLDILVNNAGVAPEVRGDLLEVNEASFDRVWKVNIKGAFFLTQLAARWMIEQTRAADSAPTLKSKIITISSISAYTASPDRGEYCIAKAALSMLTPLFAARLAEHGINVYEIRPGIISTDMTSGVQGKYDKLIAEGLTPIKRWGNPEDVARAVTCIAQDSLPFSTGEVINVDGGFHIRRL